MIHEFGDMRKVAAGAKYCIKKKLCPDEVRVKYRYIIIKR